jgi:signal transduction histidine kinase
MRHRPRRAVGLRTLLTALAFGTLGFPLALGLLVMALVSGGINEGPINRFSSVNREVRRAVLPDGRGGLSARPDYLPPSWLRLVVADGSGTVVYSNLPTLLPGAPAVNVGAAMSAVGEGPYSAPASAAAVSGLQPACVYADTVEYGGRVLGSFYALLPPIDLREAQGREFSAIRLLALGGFALFAFTLGAIVAARLAGAVVRLERSAGRIAAGDLESKVPAEGVLEIRALAEAMDRMRVSLKENLDRRNRFLAAVSHDLRTPLTSIAGYLEAVEDGLAADPLTLDRYVRIMRDKTRLLGSRIDGLLEFARMETAEWRMGFEPMDLGRFLGELCVEFGQDAGLVGRTLIQDSAAAAGLEVAADPVLLRRAFENLFSNALRYSPEGGAIHLEARLAHSALVINLDDEGPGIAPAERERIFEPFYRGSGAREGEGNGLGLYIALSVIEGHGWELSAAAAPGGGARFTIVIPSGLIS